MHYHHSSEPVELLRVQSYFIILPILSLVVRHPLQCIPAPLVTHSQPSPFPRPTPRLFFFCVCLRSYPLPPWAQASTSHCLAKKRKSSTLPSFQLQRELFTYKLTPQQTSTTISQAQHHPIHYSSSSHSNSHPPTSHPSYPPTPPPP